jgi:hypothetical protein
MQGEVTHQKTNKFENLFLAGVLSYYFAQILVTLLNGGLFNNNLGLDYLSFWSSGYIANNQGLLSVYNLEAQREVQGLYSPIDRIGVVPTPLLPIFIIPFQLFALLPLSTSFLIWTILNVLVLFIYVKKRLLNKLPIKYAFMIMLAAPVFQNFYFGQVEVWLMIFASEFLIALIDGKFFKAGVWLGSLLLKPQILILIIPYLLIQKYWRTLAGFSVFSFFTILVSFFLIGLEGLLKIKDLWLGYSAGLPSNAPEVMLNWRMLGLHSSALSSPLIGTLITVLGSIFTLYLCLPLFINRSIISLALPLLGIFSATLAVTWHSHQHMSMTLFPFLLMLLNLQIFPNKLFKAWIFIPILSYIVVIPIVLLIQLGLLPMIDAFGGLITGGCMLIFNIILVYTSRDLINKMMLSSNTFAKIRR